MSLPHATGCQCHDCQAKRSPEAVSVPEFTGVESSPVPTKQDDQIKALSAGFERNLEEQDKTGRLSQVWRECLKIHDENAMMRGNLLQMQVFIQAQMDTWMQTRADMAKVLESMQGAKCTEDYREKYKFAMQMNSDAVDMVAKFATMLRDYKKEIRMTEFQSKFYFHVNLIQMFMTAATGIVFKYVQSNEKKKQFIQEFGQLTKLFLNMENQHRQKEEE